ncbi:hypothetical protein [Nocardia sp. NPDC058666]|uniref:hypothetical protein n=1 Tax=Actinomycetes TaxID=1760 RepID=UPI003662D2AD
MAGTSIPEDTQALLAEFVDPVETIPWKNGTACNLRKDHADKHIGALAPSRDDVPGAFWLVWDDGCPTDVQVILHCTRDETCCQPAGHTDPCGNPFR